MAQAERGAPLFWLPAALSPLAEVRVAGRAGASCGSWERLWGLGPLQEFFSPLSSN